MATIHGLVKLNIYIISNRLTTFSYQATGTRLVYTINVAYELYVHSTFDFYTTDNIFNKSFKQ